MSRLPIQSVETVSGTSKETLLSLQRGLGMVPNMAGAMANAPAVLASWAQFNAALGGGELPASIRERIALFTAETNACAYCLSAHTVLGEMAGLDAKAIEAARDGEASESKAHAALAFARRILETRGGVDEADIDRVRDSGFSDAQIAEIIGAVALNLFTNIFNRAFDIEIDFPRVEPRACSTC
ncbi:MAG: carboxymuconolactone decarboxylase family protein [Phycisphaeraceae bacterium]|nr:carboxymuconolactone decarboxylase family protein [Phycisphaerales bacterium]MCB9842837.1 carboxymuconolactone decarboxylase family protein [Phycisphaeraceae bacterium]